MPREDHRLNGTGLVGQEYLTRVPGGAVGAGSLKAFADARRMPLAEMRFGEGDDVISGYIPNDQ